MADFLRPRHAKIKAAIAAAPGGSNTDSKAALGELLSHAWTAPTYVITLGQEDKEGSKAPLVGPDR